MLPSLLLACAAPDRAAIDAIALPPLDPPLAADADPPVATAVIGLDAEGRLWIDPGPGHPIPWDRSAPTIPALERALSAAQAQAREAHPDPDPHPRLYATVALAVDAQTPFSDILPIFRTATASGDPTIRVRTPSGAASLTWNAPKYCGAAAPSRPAGGPEEPPQREPEPPQPTDATSPIRLQDLLSHLGSSEAPACTTTDVVVAGDHLEIHRAALPPGASGCTYSDPTTVPTPRDPTATLPRSARALSAYLAALPEFPCEVAVLVVAEDTPWATFAALYAALLGAHPSAMVGLAPSDDQAPTHP